MLSVHTSPLAPLGGRDTGGMNVYIRQLARELSSRGIRVDVYTRASSADTPLVQEDVPGFRTISLPVGSLQPVGREELHGLLPAIAEAVDRYRIVENVEYDVLHSHYWLSGLVAMRLAERWDIPWAHMSHTLGVLKDAYRGPHQERESDLRLHSEAEVLHAADGVIVSNDVERDEVLGRYELDGSRVYVAPCGVDLGLFHPDSKTASRRRLEIGSHEKVALYVGRIEPLKALDTLIEAAAILKARMGALRVLIVGGSAGPGDTATEREIERLQALAAQLGVEDVVQFRGPVAQTALPDLYRAADVSAVPSHYESFGMAALESLACGTPVVASRVGGLQSTVRNGRNGYLVTVGDERELARRIEQVMCRPDLATRLSREAAHTARRYSWQRVADHNVGVYHNLLAAGHVRVPMLVCHDLSV